MSGEVSYDGRTSRRSYVTGSRGSWIVMHWDRRLAIYREGGTFETRAAALEAMHESSGPMRLTETPNGVELSYVDAHEGRRVTRTFFVSSTDPDKPSYVREWVGRDAKQVCDELASLGDTLRATGNTLARVIRREYRAMRRAEAKAWGTR